MFEVLVNSLVQFVIECLIAIILIAVGYIAFCSFPVVSLLVLVSVGRRKDPIKELIGLVEEAERVGF